MTKRQKAFAYLRTSSATNVGSDKDSGRRQQEAIRTFARRAGYELVAEFNDEAVSGSDRIEIRPGFCRLLDAIEENGVRVVVVEDASRFARDLMAQELGVIALQQRGVMVLTANGDDLTATHDPMKVAMRQIAGAFAQLEKARLVAKLAAARTRKREVTGQCEGRYPRLPDEAIEAAKALARKRKQPLSLRKIAAVLEQQGHVSSTGRQFSAKSIAAMLQR